jgi:hypothetical protein
MVECEERDRLYRKIDEVQRKLYELNHFLDTQNRSTAQKLQKQIERLHNALSSHCAKHRCHAGLGSWGVSR